MPDADRIRDAATVAAILTACGLAWLSVRVPNVLSQGWFWGAIAGLLLAVVGLTVGQR
jgi:predicted benzoate:H+ symporter BenE